jgi:transcription antitermination factor NusG
LRIKVYTARLNRIAVPQTQGHIDVIVSSSWGVLVAQHQRSKLVGEELSVREVEHFIPLEEKLTITRGRRTRVFYPLLGDYILIAISSLWREVMSIKGVAGILLNELNYPAQVFPHEIDRMRSMCNNNVFIPMPDKMEFQYGQRVTPKSNTNPFAFHVGRYDRKTRRGDAANFSLFGREQCVIFRRGELISA